MPAKMSSQYRAHPRLPENVGSPVKQLYTPIFDDRGVMHLKEAGKHDLYGEIQSHKDSVDIHVLLARYRNGDTEALQRVQGAYGDFTQMPTTFAEALNTMIAAQQYFQGLPVEVRSRFGHDFNRFIASMDSPTWAADVGLDLPEPPAPPTPPVVNIEDQNKPPIPAQPAQPVSAEPSPAPAPAA